MPERLTTANAAGHTQPTRRPRPARWLYLAITAACITLAGPMGIANAADGPTDPYLAVREDGTTFSGVALRDWRDANKPDRLDGTPLHADRNPVVALHRVGIRPHLKPPFVELTRGDVLPAALIAVADAPEPGADRLRFRRGPTATTGGRPFDVVMQAADIRRVVFDPRGVEADVAPGEVLLLDGRRLTGRAIRFAPGVVRMLTDDGIETLGWSELAAVGLNPRSDAEDIHAAQRPPGLPPEARVARVTAADGTVITGFTTEAAARTHGRNREHETTLWYSPTWADSQVPIRLDQVASWSFRTPDEVPLALLPAETTANATMTGYTWRWRRLVGLRGEPAAFADAPADLAVSMHSLTAIRYRVPSTARSLTGRVGIAAAVDEGGCAVAAVHRKHRRSKPAWRSGYLLGGEPSESFSVGQWGGVDTVELLVDYGHDGRPDGADPLDIRDEAVWSRPMFVMSPPDPTADDALHAAMPATAGWSVVGEDGTRPYVRGRLASGRYASAREVSAGRGFVIERAIRTDGEPRLVTMEVEVLNGSEPVRVAGSIDGEPVAVAVDARAAEEGVTIAEPGGVSVTIRMPPGDRDTRRVRVQIEPANEDDRNPVASVYIHRIVDTAAADADLEGGGS